MVKGNSLMAMLSAVFLALVFGMIGCSQSTNTSTKSEPPLGIADLPATVIVKQRSTTTIPGSRNGLSISTEDITHGQVAVSITQSEGDALLGPVSLRLNESRTFRFKESEYSLTLTALENALIGEDFATFAIAEGSLPQRSEIELIGQLISSIESLEGAVFIRNAKEYSPTDAAIHLRRKLEAADDKTMTASDFVQRLASSSSVSGEDYIIQLRGGQSILARDYLNEQLPRLQSGSGNE